MTFTNQLSLSLKSGDIKIHLNASNDGDLTLTGLVNRPAYSGVGSVLPSSHDSDGIWMPKGIKYDPDNIAPSNELYQPDISYGRITADAEAPRPTWGNLNLSLHRRDRPVLMFLLNELKTYLSRQRFHAQTYLDAIDSILANLIEAYSAKKQLMIRLDTSSYTHPRNNNRGITNKIILEVVGFLEDKDLIQVVAGAKNESAGISSWCVARSSLIAIFDRNKMRTRLAEGCSLAVIRERPERTSHHGKERITGKLITLPESSREWQKLKRSEEPVLRYSELWLSHTATLNGYHLSPWLNRIFIESTQLGGRFYGSYQNLPRVDRKHILIDGERTVELDFDSLHIAILYAQAGIPLASDPYLIDGFDRNAVKQVFLRLTNTSNLSALEGQITLSGDPEKKEQYIRYKMQLDIYKAHKVLGLRCCAKPFIPDWFHHFIEGLPDHITGRELIETIKARHPAIAHRFGEDDIGLKLQRVDSEIMARAMTMLAGEGVPMLSVHDSVICRVSDEWVVRTALEQATEELFCIKLKLSKK